MLLQFRINVNAMKKPIILLLLLFPLFVAAQQKVFRRHLLSTRWGQNKPYNELCPTMDGKTCLVGCNATAVAQVLYYWYVQRGVVPHTCPLEAYVSVDSKLPVAAVDSLPSGLWKTLSPIYDRHSTYKQRRAVAQLMRYVGHSMQVSYDTENSMCNFRRMYAALINRWGMDAQARIVTRRGYSAREWERLLRNEIEAGRPVIMEGFQDIYDDDGHAFVVDGYDRATSRFHINMGWGGKSNGLYSLDSIYPPTENKNYIANQRAIIGLQPAMQQRATNHVLTSSMMWLSEDKLFVDYYNYTPDTVVFRMGLAEVLDADSICLISSLRSPSTFTPDFGYGQAHWDLSFQLRHNRIQCGHAYEVAPVHRVETADSIGPWQLSSSETRPATARLSVDEQGRFSLARIGLGTPHFLLTSLSPDSILPCGRQLPFRLQVSSTGGDYYNSFYMRVRLVDDSLTTSVVPPSKLSSNVGDGESVVYDLNLRFMKDGVYDLCLTQAKNGEGPIYSRRFVIGRRKEH